MSRFVTGIVAAFAAVVLLAAPAFGQNTTVYLEQGGSKLVIASGGEIEALSGATLDLQNEEVVVGTKLGIENSSTGAVTVNLHDYADTADDDQAHGVIETNCTDASTGAEDCDMTFKIAVAGAAPAAWLAADADGNVTGTSHEWVITIQNGAAPGATCSVGEIFIDTDETDDTNCTTTADNSLCICTAADTWTALENN